ncbi:MAG: hypothetical protein SPJ70_02865 [Candidatus Borkfalkiaceae bacterium]|nr:hypothetical protein [Eubacteriales bacterium]MDY5820233.1 hypothetical protein [Christensenellaceae bacterium]
MIYYLYSSKSSAVKIDGKFVGVTDGNYFAFEADNALIEIIPLDNSWLPVTAYLSGEAQSLPQLKIIDMRGGTLLLPEFSHRFVTDFKLLFRGRKEFSVGALAVTCYSENGVRLIVETAKDMYVESLPFTPDDARFEKVDSGDREYLLCVFVGKRSLVLAYSITDKIKLELKRVCDDYSVNLPFITLIERKSDIAKHIVSSCWKFADGVRGQTLIVTRRRQIYTLDEKLIPYAFFEELLCGGDVSDFLSPKLKPRAKDFKEFVGDFIAVLPPPNFVKQSLVTLLYKDKIEYADVKLNGGLIENVVLT